MLPSQMMKGILDNCILIVIAQEDTYGYDISQKLKSYGFSDISRVRFIRCFFDWRKTDVSTVNFANRLTAPIENTIPLQKPVIWKYRIL